MEKKDKEINEIIIEQTEERNIFQDEPELSEVIETPEIAVQEEEDDEFLEFLKEVFPPSVNDPIINVSIDIPSEETSEVSVVTLPYVYNKKPEEAKPVVVDIAPKVNKEEVEISKPAILIRSENQSIIDLIKEKVKNIKIGKNVTVIYGTGYTNQKVLRGRFVSVIDYIGITILNSDEMQENDPIVIGFDTIIDIFENKRPKKAKKSFSFFKLNKKFKEFFTGDEEEVKQAYNQKITVKKLRDELKPKKEKKK